MKKINLSIWKNSALKAFNKGRIPKELCKAILDCEPKEEFKSYVDMLFVLTKHYTRVDGYYKEYKDVHALANNEIVEAIHRYKLERGFN